MNAARIIANARRRAGLTLRALAGPAGTSHATLAAYEAGRKVPTVATLDRIVRAAGFRVDDTLVPDVGGTGPTLRGDELAEVLHLAALFPARHSPTLTCPRFGANVR